MFNELSHYLLGQLDVDISNFESWMQIWSNSYTVMSLAENLVIGQSIILLANKITTEPFQSLLLVDVLFVSFGRLAGSSL